MKNLDYFLAVFLLVSLVVIAFLQVVFRFLFNLPLDWTEESARYIFIFLVYISCSIAIKEDSMIKIDILDIIVNKFIKIIISVILDVISSFFSIYMAYLFYLFISNSVSFGIQKTPALGVSIWILYSIEGILFLIIGIYYIVNVINAIRSKTNDI